MQYKLTVKVEASGETEVKQLGSLLQKVLQTSNNQEIIRLFDKVVKNPSLVKTALKFA